jgi:hypothetical protein
VKADGVQCGSPAMKKKDYCYFHHQQRDRKRRMDCNPYFSLPVLENGDAVQVALMNVLDRLNSKTIDHRSAALILYGLQVASANLKRTRFGLAGSSMVVAVPEEKEPQQVLRPLTPDMREAIGATSDLPPGDPRLDKVFIKRLVEGELKQHV